MIYPYNFGDNDFLRQYRGDRDCNCGYDDCFTCYMNLMVEQHENYIRQAKDILTEAKSLLTKPASYLSVTEGDEISLRGLGVRW